ncbi:DUF3325 domain-containing protein [Roseomonas sp. WA12]
MILTSFGLTYGAFTALSLAMDRHQRDVFGRKLPPHRTRALRLLGWGALPLSLVPCILVQGWAIGPVLWCGLLALAAGLLVLLIPYAPRAVPVLGTLLPALALALLAVQAP